MSICSGHPLSVSPVEESYRGHSFAEVTDISTVRGVPLTGVGLDGRYAKTTKSEATMWIDASDTTDGPLTEEDIREAIAAAEATEPKPDYYQDGPEMRRALGIPPKEES